MPFEMRTMGRRDLWSISASESKVATTSRGNASSSVLTAWLPAAPASIQPSIPRTRIGWSRTGQFLMEAKGIVVRVGRLPAAPGNAGPVGGAVVWRRKT